MTLLMAAVAVLVSTTIARFVRQWALASEYVDRPGPRGGRKIHDTPTPFGGGVVIALSWAIGIAVWVLVAGWPDRPTVGSTQLIGVLVSCIVLLLGGYLDDRYRLSAWMQLLVSVLAVGVLLLSDIRLTSLRLPWDGVISFVWAQGSVGGILRWVWPADLLTVLWVLSISYSTKLFDGIDGLVTGIGAIGGVILFAVSLVPTLNQPQNAMIALLFAGSCLGFLFWNWNPAKIFLGQGGSVLVGHVLAALSIMTGTKVMTTLLVVGIALFDLGWVVVRRTIIEHRSPFSGDRGHFHHRLLDRGFTQRQAATLLLSISALFGLLAVALQTAQKIFALAALVAVCSILAAAVAAGGRSKTRD